MQRVAASQRKAGRTYGAPITGAGLAPPAAGARAMPELRTVGEEARQAWMRVRAKPCTEARKMSTQPVKVEMPCRLYLAL